MQLDGATRQHLDLLLESAGRAPHPVKLEGSGDQRPAARQRPAFVQHDAEPAAQPLEEVLGGQPGIEVRRKVVEGREDGGQCSVERGHEALGEVIFLVQRRQGLAQGMGTDQVAHQAAVLIDGNGGGDHAPSTSTWCSYENTRACGSITSRCTAWPRCPLTGSAPKRRASSTSSVPRNPCSTE